MQLKRSLKLGLALGLFVFGPTLVEGQCTPTWVISGTVVDNNGVGLVGYDLDILLGGNALVVSQDFTVLGGVFNIVICAEGGTPQTDTYTLAVNPPAGSHFFPASFQSFLGGTGSVGALALDPGFLVSGVVTNEQNIPLEEADLQFSDPVTGTLIQFSGEATDPAGAFTVLVTPGTYDIVVRELPLTTNPAGPYVSVQLQDRVIDADVDLGTLVLRDAYILNGTVLNNLGALLNGADIDVRDASTGAEVLLSGDITGQAAPMGQFSVEVPSGTWEVEIEPPTGSGLAAALRIVTITPPGPTTLPTVQLPLGVAVSGSTRTVLNAPVGSVDLDFIISATGVEIATADDNADPAGNFSVIVVPDTYDIHFKPPFDTELAPVALENQLINGPTALGSVTLPNGNALTGIVTLNGVPVAGSRVTLSQAGVSVVTFGNTSNAVGSYALRQVPGLYDVTASPVFGGGGSPVTVSGVDLSTDQVVNFDLGAPTPPPPVDTLSCVGSATEVTLSWILAAGDYDSILVTRDGIVIATLAGTQTSLIDGPLAAGVYLYSVHATRAGLDSTPVSCSGTVGTPPGVPFIRGDGNQDGAVNIADAIGILGGLFDSSIPPGPCADADDSNDDGGVNIADAIYTLFFLFAQGPAPQAPHPALGSDPTPDSLDCF